MVLTKRKPLTGLVLIFQGGIKQGQKPFNTHTIFNGRDMDLKSTLMKRYDKYERGGRRGLLIVLTLLHLRFQLKC